MPKVLDEDQLRRKKQLEEKRAARRAAKEEEERKKLEAVVAPDDSEKAADSSPQGPCRLLDLPDEALYDIFAHLSVAELGRLLLTSKSMNQLLSHLRPFWMQSRLQVPTPRTATVGFTNLCASPNDALALLKQSYGGGDTGRVIPKGKYLKQVPNEFLGYARFVEEAVTGHSTLSTGNLSDPILLPRFAEGRFVSVSPEHTLCRVGGDGAQSGPGGSGVASWGVGRRGQLGHGKRQDERIPRRILGLGYGIRIVQVSAGGGLVRVAHSLLLTSTGRVLSFGTGQYGALGHGYSAAKQLPDMLRPQYVEGLSSVRCVCVAAGELHSAVVTSDGDVYTWGDGFCGQLGHADKRPQTSPKQVTHGGLEDECVASIACGSRHTLAVTEDGEVFSWGLGHFGVLGRAYTPFDYDADAAVQAFAAGGEDGVLPGPIGQAPIPEEGPVVADEELLVAPAVRDFAAELAAHLDLIANLSLDDSSNQCIPQPIESLRHVRVVGASAGHRHSLLLDDQGGLYSFGSGGTGCLGHGDTESQMYPVRVASFDDTRIRQMSAGVDMSMAVSTTGEVYAWGKTAGGRIGLPEGSNVTLPRQVSHSGPAVDVECGYVHSVIVGLDGTLTVCGHVGLGEEADGRRDDELEGPQSIPNFNIWHRLPPPREEVVQTARWKKYGKYEVKGRSQMMEESA